MKSPGGHLLAIFATLPTALALNGTDNMQLSSPSKRYNHEGKTAKALTVSSRNLREHGGNGATPALDSSKEKGSVTEGRLYVNWIPSSETLKNVFVEEWLDVSGDSSEGQKTISAPVRIITMAHNNETPAGQINFTQNSIELPPTAVVLWPRERRVSAMRQMVTVLTTATTGHRHTREKNAPAREGKNRETESCSDAPNTTTQGWQWCHGNIRNFMGSGVQCIIVQRQAPLPCNIVNQEQSDKRVRS